MAFSLTQNFINAIDLLISRHCLVFLFMQVGKKSPRVDRALSGFIHCISQLFPLHSRTPQGAARVALNPRYAVTSRLPQLQSHALLGGKELI